jgi:hypothetical protein
MDREAAGGLSIMPRPPHVANGGYAYHVLDRAVRRTRILRKQRNFEAFEEIVGQAKQRRPMRASAWGCGPFARPPARRFGMG